MSVIFEVDKNLKTSLMNNGIKNVSLYVFSDVSKDFSYNKNHFVVSDKILYVLDEKHNIINKLTNEEIDEIKIDYLLNYGRIYAVKDNKYTLIGCFSKHLSKHFSAFKKHFNDAINEKEILKDKRISNKCPSCGRILRNDQTYCPKCYSKKNTLFRLLSYIKKYKIAIVLLVLLLLITGAIGVFTPILTNQIFYNEVLNPEGKFFNKILLFASFFMFLKVCGCLIRILYGRLFANTSAKICFDMKNDVFQAMQRLSLNFFKDKDTGSLMNRVVWDVNMIFYFIIEDMPKFIISLMETVGIAIYLLCLKFELALLVCLPLPFVLVVLVYFMPMFRRNWEQNAARNNELNSMVSDTLEGFRVVKVFSRHKKESYRFEKISDKNKKSFVKNHQLRSIIYPITQLIAAVSVVIVWVIGGYFVITNNGMDYGIFATFVAGVELLFVPLESMSNIIFTNLPRVISCSRRIFEIIDSKEEIKESDNPIYLEKIDGNIEFKNVTFGYESNKFVLDNISFNIKANTSLGIVGQTGVGKTTLVNLLSRLYDINDGQILIDGIDIKQIALKSLHQHISLISQDTYLFKGSVLENIRYAKPNATYQEVIEAAKIANAHEFILSLKNGYETIIGEGHTLLSTGQRQRISIARAVLLNSKIIIFDEATSAMDTITEKAIQESISNISKGKTVIIIAHRLSTLNDVDQIIVIDKHKIVEKGTMQELIDNNKTFTKLYKIQKEALDYIKVGGDI